MRTVPLVLLVGVVLLIVPEPMTSMLGLLTIVAALALLVL